MCISEAEKGERKGKLLKYYIWLLKWESKNDRMIWKENKLGQEDKS